MTTVPRPSADWCTFVRERMELFLDGELTGSENLGFLTHIKECDDCSKYWAHDELVALTLMQHVATGNAVGTRSAEKSARPRDPSGSAASAPVSETRPWDLRGVRLNRLQVALAAACLIVATTAVLFQFSGNEGVQERLPTGSLAELVQVRGDARVLDGLGGEWRPALAGESARDGMSIRCAEGALVGLSLGGRSSIVFDESSEATLDRVGDDSDELVFDLREGAFAADVVDLPFTVGVDDVTLEGDSAAFRVTIPVAGEGSAEITVSRGEVRARSGGNRRTLAARETVRVVGSAFVAPIADRSRSNEIENDRLASLVAELTRRIDAADSINARLNSEAAELRRRLSARAVTAEIPHSSETHEGVIADYLEKVDLTNWVDVTSPNAYAIKAVDDLRRFGPVVVPTLVGLMEQQPKRLRRAALLGLLGGLGFQECFEPLMRACFDHEEDIRGGALWFLDRSGRPELVAHFMAMHGLESAPWLKARAAFAAARSGAAAGVNALISDYFDATDGRSRLAALHMLVKLDANDAVLPLLRRIVVTWTSGSSESGLRLAVKRLVELGDDEVVPALREVLGREGLPADIRRFVEEALLRLEN